MKAKSLLVDTGAWFALVDKSDSYHKRAVSLFPKLIKDYNQLISTNLIIAETYILIRRSIGHPPAITFLENIAASPRVIKIYSDDVVEKNAEDILRKYHDQKFSYTDAVSFTVMKQLGIREAFSFDHHFVIAGFTTIP